VEDDGTLPSSSYTLATATHSVRCRRHGSVGKKLEAAAETKHWRGATAADYCPLLLLLFLLLLFFIILHIATAKNELL
jgi:hypothetical protein